MECCNQDVCCVRLYFTFVCVTKKRRLSMYLITGNPTYRSNQSEFIPHTTFPLEVTLYEFLQVPIVDKQEGR